MERRNLREKVNAVLVPILTVFLTSRSLLTCGAQSFSVISKHCFVGKRVTSPVHG